MRPCRAGLIDCQQTACAIACVIHTPVIQGEQGIRPHLRRFRGTCAHLQTACGRLAVQLCDAQRDTYGHCDHFTSLKNSSSHLNGRSPLSLPPCAQLLRWHQRLQRAAALAQLGQVALHGCADVLCTQRHGTLQ